MPQIDQRTAGYLPPSEAPFRCGSCEYFREPQACELVEGRIMPEGCCNLFEKSDTEKSWKGDADAERV